MADAPKVAVLVDPALAKDPLAALLEQALAARKDLATLERSQLNLVVDEATLKQLSGDDRGQRVKAISALKTADALVVVRPGEKSPVATLCETRRGLRLLRLPILDAAGAETAAADIARRLPALMKQDAQVWAVPSLISRNLTAEHDHLKTSLARLIEQTLTSRGDVLCVELSEAKALADEVALGAPGVSRDLPYYILGEFRHASAKSDATVNLTLQLQQGARSLQKVALEQVVSEKLAASLAEQVAAFAATAGGQPRQFDPAAEAAILARRATALSTLGDLDEPIALIEGAVLLNPQDMQVRQDALMIYRRKVSSLVELHGRRGDVPRTRQDKESSVVAAVGFYVRSLDHLRVAYLKQLETVKDQKGSGPLGELSRISAYWIYSLGRSERDFPTPAIREAINRLAEAERETMVPLAARELTIYPRSWIAGDRNALWRDPLGEKDVRIERILAVVQRLPDDPALAPAVWWCVWQGFMLNYDFKGVPMEDVEAKLRPPEQNVAQLRALPQAAAKGWADYVEQQLIERRRFEVAAREPKPKKPTTSPTSKPATTQPLAAPIATVKLAPADFNWPATVRPGRFESQFRFWVPLPGDRAIVGSRKQLFWLDGRDKIRPIPFNEPIATVRTDGELAWFCGLNNSDLMVVCDLKTERMKRVETAKLLPPGNWPMVVPLGGRKAVAVGGFRPGAVGPPRTWVAVLTIAEDLSVTAEVVHEAIDRPPDHAVAARQPLPSEAFAAYNDGEVWLKDGKITHVQVGRHHVFDVEKRQLNTIKPIFSVMNPNPAIHDGTVWNLKTPGSSIDQKPLQLIRRGPDGEVTVEAKSLPFNGFKQPAIDLFAAGPGFILRKEKRFWAYDLSTKQIAEVPMPAEFQHASDEFGMRGDVWTLWVNHAGQTLAIDPPTWKVVAVTIEMPQKPQ